MSKHERFPFDRHPSKAMQALYGFSAALRESSIGVGLVDLIFLRVSQLNGCAYCTDLHWRDLIKAGVEPRVLNTLCVWQESPFFTPRERAALAWTEALTRAPHPQRETEQDEAYAALGPLFSEPEISEINLAIANMNAWNRIGVGMRNAIPLAL